MLIEVTQEHIDVGERRKTSTCPVALALTDRLPGVRRLAVWLTVDGDPKIMLRKFNLQFELPLPPEVGTFIQTFDGDGPTAITPFAFTLPTMPEWALGD